MLSTRAVIVLGAVGTIACQRAPGPAHGDDKAQPPVSSASMTVHWPADSFSRQLPYQVPDSIRQRIPSCDGTPRVSSDSLGPWAAGATLEDLLARCPDVWAFFRFEEGDEYPAVAVRVAGAIIQAELEDSLPSSKATRLISFDPAAATREMVGPGASLERLEATYGTASLGTAECTIYAWSERLPGVSWMLYFPEGWDCMRADSAGTPGASRPPGKTSLAAVIVIGTARAPN